MKAIIPAAGVGKRLLPYTKETPKALLEVAGKPILEHIITTFRECAIDEIVLIVGHGQNQIREFVKSRSLKKIKFVYNPTYSSDGSLGSTWRAKKEMNESFLYLHSDMLFEKGIVEEILKVREDIVVSMDRKKTYLEEDMRIKLKDGYLWEINKSISLSETDGEFTGFLKFSKRGAKKLERFLDIMVKEGYRDTYFEDCLERMAKDGIRIIPLETKGKKWIEIDFLEDLKKAGQVFS